jgi:hypothetical protein
MSHISHMSNKTCGSHNLHRRNHFKKEEPYFALFRACLWRDSRYMRTLASCHPGVSGTAGPSAVPGDQQQSWWQKPIPMWMCGKSNTINIHEPYEPSPNGRFMMVYDGLWHWVAQITDTSDTWDGRQYKARVSPLPTIPRWQRPKSLNCWQIL